MARSRSPVVSAGVAVLRERAGSVEVFLVHPGGPYWAKKDTHGWSIPKGEVDPDDLADPTTGDPITGGPLELSDELLERVARRELAEETGQSLPAGAPPLLALAEVKLSSAKRLRAFAVAGDLDPDAITSNTFTMEWPPRSGRQQSFPEVDRAAWFTLDEATTKLHKGQVPLVDLLRAVADDVLGATR